ncbi:uncharacterized protein Dwil_GK15346 [Drosophila willistoni]|uniref:Uncharacterized protein n=1 Tax=Drosophila willistoni TaxID=7260 RepID=B4MUN8_DROWI|nr:uncharacterized protein LOC6642049 [Drosophila willistoni]EDW76233.1 uncharacterized protein Dwil_GK15346 [Drosophila willistoni]
MSLLAGVVPLTLLLMQCIARQEAFPMESLVKLHDLVTIRIKTTLEQEQNIHPNEEFMRHYKLLADAAELPFELLDEKIVVYNAYKAYTEAQLGGTDQSLEVNDETENRLTSRQSFSTFEKRILKLLKKLGIYDPFSERVFKAIFSDEKQLKKLKKKLDELGKKEKEEKESEDKEILWDFIYGLFW